MDDLFYYTFITRHIHDLIVFPIRKLNCAFSHADNDIIYYKAWCDNGDWKEVYSSLYDAFDEELNIDHVRKYREIAEWRLIEWVYWHQIRVRYPHYLNQSYQNMERLTGWINRIRNPIRTQNLLVLV